MTTEADEAQRINATDQRSLQKHVADLHGIDCEAVEATVSPAAGGKNKPATDEPAGEPALFISGPLF